MGWWQAWGDASYGFLVEVQPLLPTLAVDESRIVAAEVDGPGHFEYTDRLGADILARIEGLRAYATEQELARANAVLAPFGHRLEARFDTEWNRTVHDLYHEGQAEPMLPGLLHVWPVSVNASGTDFVLAAENAPNVSPLYLLVQDGRVEPWDADQNAFLPPAYVGDALARVTFTGFPTLTYQVELENGRPELDSLTVYTGTAVAQGAYMPLRSFTAWEGHWVLEVDDHLIMDGQDLGEALGYGATYSFTLIRGQPFYFFEQDGKVRISFGGKTLPHVYDRVIHNQCCEAGIHNVEILGDAVVFHALWNGTWYLVEAGVYDGEMVGTYRYMASEGWSFRYPMHWDRLDEELGFVQDTAAGKTVTFASQPTTWEELERWLESEIDRKLAASEAGNSLAEPLTTEQKGDLIIYRYAILSRLEATEVLLRTTVFFDGRRRYEFYAAIPTVAEEEYRAILDSFQAGPHSTGLVLQGNGLGVVHFGDNAESAIGVLANLLGAPDLDTGWLDPSLPTSEPLWPGCPGMIARMLSWEGPGLSIVLNDWAQNAGDFRASAGHPYFAGYSAGAAEPPQLWTAQGAHPGMTLTEMAALYGERLFISPEPDQAVGLYWFAIDGTDSPLTRSGGIRGWLLEPDINSPDYRPGLEPGEALETRGFTAGLSCSTP